MQQYVKELEDLIVNTLLPVYYEHYRLLGRSSPANEINKVLTGAMSRRRQVPALLQRKSYGRHKV